MCVVCAVFGSAFRRASENDDTRHPMHVGKGGFPVWVMFETFGRYGNIETVVWEVDGFSVADVVNTGAGCNIDTDVTGWGEEIADCSVDVEGTNF